MKIIASQLKAIMPNIASNLKANKNFKGQTIESVTALLNKYAEEFEIVTPLQWVHYLAQIAHECAELRTSEENLNYSVEGLLKVFPKYFNKTNVSAYARKPEKIASRVYGGRMGNGVEATGEGWKYRGRGLIQLTGKSNYEAYKKYCGFDVVAQPDLLAQPIGAIRSSMWFWKKNGLNALADKDDTVGITKKINGGTNGLYERRNYVTKAKKVFVL